MATEIPEVYIPSGDGQQIDAYPEPVPTTPFTPIPRLRLVTSYKIGYGGSPAFDEYHLITWIPSTEAGFEGHPFRTGRELKSLTADTRVNVLAGGAENRMIRADDLVSASKTLLLIEARESQVVPGWDGRGYLCIPRTGQPRLGLVPVKSYIGRLMVVTMEDEDVKVLVRTRKADDSYGGYLEIAGGSHFVRGQGFTVTSQTIDREFEEEYSPLIPGISSRPGCFLTYIEVRKPDGKTAALFEITELAVLSPLVFNSLLKVGRDKGRAYGIRARNDWRAESLKGALRGKQPILPSIRACLERLTGNYLTHDVITDIQNGDKNVSVYGEFIPYGRSYFETRSQSLVDTVIAPRLAPSR